jgi:hypothetical protein
VSESEQAQPILPRISMRWYFIVVVAISIVLTWLNQSSNQKSLVVTTILFAIAAGTFLMMAAGCFLIASLFGAVEKLFRNSELQTESPFADESMPPQIIPPSSRG